VKRRGCYVSGVNTGITDWLKELIEDAVEEYNKYRSPEANAKIVRIEKHCFQVDFTGFLQNMWFLRLLRRFKNNTGEQGFKNKDYGDRRER
jgi:hypothetical protein